MTPIPTPSAWRYEYREDGSFVSYEYATARPEVTHKNCVPMYSAGKLNSHGKACYEEGRDARAPAEAMDEVASRFAHSLALELECLLADRGTNWNRAMNLIGEYRSAMNAIHEQHSPTSFGEPVLRQIKREHVTSGEPCWCEPETSYVDPDTGVAVIVHKEPQ